MKDLETLFRKAIDECVFRLAWQQTNYQVSLTPDSNKGDLATSLSLSLAKILKKTPLSIAEELAECLRQSDLFREVTVAPPGFVNVIFDDSILHKFADWFLDYHKKRNGRTQPCTKSELVSPLEQREKRQRILLEFVSANPTGPLNAVSARAGAAGDHLARLQIVAGNDVDCEYYVNDVGRQVQLLVTSILVRAKQIHDALADKNQKMEAIEGSVSEFINSTPNFTVDDYPDSELPEDGYRGSYIIKLAYYLEARYGDLQKQTHLKDMVVSTLMEWIQTDLASFGVNEMQLFFQHYLHGENELDTEVLAIYERLGLLYEQEGAIWLRSTALGDDQDWVLIRKDQGGPTYFLADIAYHLEKAQRGYDLAVDIWGPDHHAHVKRLYLALPPLLVEKGYYDTTSAAESFQRILIAQQVNLIDNQGEVMKMSKRAGNLVTLHELIRDLGVDVSRFFFLDRSLSSHLDFNLELARKETSENPIFKIQYVTARIASLMKKAKSEGLEVPVHPDWSNLKSPMERNLLRLISDLPRTVRLAADSWEVHRVPAVLLDMAGEFHRWYDTHRIIGEPEPVALARLALAESLRGAICWGLDLLGISAPLSM